MCAWERHTPRHWMRGADRKILPTFYHDDRARRFAFAMGGDWPFPTKPRRIEEIRQGFLAYFRQLPPSYLTAEELAKLETSA